MTEIKLSDETSFYANCLMRIKGFTNEVAENQKKQWGDNVQTDEKLERFFISTYQAESIILQYMNDSIRGNIDPQKMII